MIMTYSLRRSAPLWPVIRTTIERLIAIAMVSFIATAAFAADRVTAGDTVGITVSDMDRAVAFYTSVLTFEKVADAEIDGREFELLTGVFGARARIVRLRLGTESIALTEYLAPRGRPIPPDMRANDRSFQHIAIIVSDMDTAFGRLHE